MKPAAAAVAAALLVTVLAGCSGPGDGGPGPAVRAPFDPATLSPKVHAALPVEGVAVASSADGKLLEAAVYRPDTDEPVPVFINFSPYWGDTALHGGDPFARYMVEEYVPRGYAVVLTSVRGTGHSEGCFQIAGDLELQDAHDVIDHFASQPWSNGNVAGGGKSYDSTTQNGVVAKVPHPALKGLFHVSGITDMYRYNAKDGVVYNNGLQFTPRYYALQAFDEYLGATNGAGAADDETPQSLARLADDLACPELAEHIVSAQGTAAHGMRDAYWQERNWNLHLPASDWNGSVFFVHGLQDWNVKPDHILPWVSLLEEKGIDTLGWLHQDKVNLGHVYPMRTDWNETMLRWLDHTLKGKDTRMDALWGFEAEGSDGVWRRSASWPPEPTWWVSSATGAEGGAREAPAGGMRIAGEPYATVTLTASGADPIARVVLWHEGPGGSRTWVTEAVRRVALDDALSGPRGYVPGAPVTLNLTFFPVDHVVPAGHRLAWTVGAESAAGSGTPADFFWTPAQVEGIEYSAVEVALPMADLEPSLRQPGRMACFAC